MNRRTFLKTLPALTVLTGAASSFAQEASGSAQDLQPITLPKPQTDSGKSVLAALQERRTIRNISAEKLPPQILSDLLWAAFGVNLEKSAFGKPGRTAASASNSQEIDLYVALPEGVYLYEAVPHRLTPVVAGDFRARAGRSAAIRLRLISSTSWISPDTIRGRGSPTEKLGIQRSRSLTIMSPRVSLPRTSICSRPRKVWRLGSTIAIR